MGDRFVVGVHARFSINEEDDDIRLIRCGERLSGNGTLERIIAAHFDTAGIDQGESTTVPVGRMIRTIARYTAHFMHNCFVVFRKAVDHSGFTHVRTANNSHDRQ